MDHEYIPLGTNREAGTTLKDNTVNAHQIEFTLAHGHFDLVGCDPVAEI